MLGIAIVIYVDYRKSISLLPFHVKNIRRSLSRIPVLREESYLEKKKLPIPENKGVLILTLG